VTSADPRESLLDAMAGELHGGPLARRRILTELADHIDDAVDDLRSSGVPREKAIEEAVKRVGDPETILNAFGASRARTARRWRRRTRLSLAWIALAAMSVVTAVAAELPEVSGAKAPAKVLAPASRPLAPPGHPTARRSSLAKHDRRTSRAQPPR
jgi:hypothetical protein